MPHYKGLSQHEFNALVKESEDGVCNCLVSTLKYDKNLESMLNGCPTEIVYNFLRIAEEREEYAVCAVIKKHIDNNGF